MEGVTVDLNQMPTEQCSCGWSFWKQRAIIKRVPGIIAGKANDDYPVVNFMACEKCGKPHHSTKIAVSAPKYNSDNKQTLE